MKRDRLQWPELTQPPRYCCDGNCNQGRACPAIDETIGCDSAPTPRENWGFWITICICTLIAFVGMGSAVAWFAK